jgi:PIN domain nuclease of toxin-antitoxin system
MSAVLVDSHVIVWHLSQPSKLSPSAQRSIEEAEQTGQPIYISAISIVEICYLVERGKILAEVLDTLVDAIDSAETSYVLYPRNREVAIGLREVPREHVPDMPDRIIASTALHLGIPLVTKDEKLLASAVNTIW